MRMAQWDDSTIAFYRHHKSLVAPPSCGHINALVEPDLPEHFGIDTISFDIAWLDSCHTRSWNYFLCQFDLTNSDTAATRL